MNGTPEQSSRAMRVQALGCVSAFTGLRSRWFAKLAVHSEDNVDAQLVGGNGHGHPMPSGAGCVEGHPATLGGARGLSAPPARIEADFGLQLLASVFKVWALRP